MEFDCIGSWSLPFYLLGWKLSMHNIQTWASHDFVEGPYAVLTGPYMARIGKMAILRVDPIYITRTYTHGPHRAPYSPKRLILRVFLWDPHGTAVRCPLDRSYDSFQARNVPAGTRRMPGRELTEPVGYTYGSQSPTGPGTPVSHLWPRH